MADPTALHEIEGHGTKDNFGSAFEVLTVSSENTKMGSLALTDIKTTGESSKSDRVHLSKADTDRTSFKKLYIFCGVLLTIIIILAVTLGVLTNNLIMRMEALEAKSGPVAANSGNILGIVARISTLEINTTAEHATEMTAIEANQQRISELESTNNDSKIIYGDMKLRLDNLEDELQAKIKTLEGPVAAYNGSIQEIDARITKLEINTTAEHETEMTAIEANQQRISELQSTTNDNKILYENMELRLNNLEGPVAANSGNIQGIVARISTLEINTTAEHATEMTAIEANQHRISELESTTNYSKILYENMELRLNNLEDELSKPCPPPYIYNATIGLCWRLETEKELEWNYARSQCTTEGGDLIALDTPEKIAYIQTALAGMSISDDGIWVGGHDQLEEGKFKWVNGAPVQGIPWQSNEPNNLYGNEDCMAIYKSKGLFNDSICTRIRSFLCELS